MLVSCRLFVTLCYLHCYESTNETFNLNKATLMYLLIKKVSELFTVVRPWPMAYVLSWVMCGPRVCGEGLYKALC